MDIVEILKGANGSLRANLVFSGVYSSGIRRLMDDYARCSKELGYSNGTFPFDQKLCAPITIRGKNVDMTFSRKRIGASVSSKGDIDISRAVAKKFNWKEAGSQGYVVDSGVVYPKGVCSTLFEMGGPADVTHECLAAISDYLSTKYSRDCRMTIGYNALTLDEIRIIPDGFGFVGDYRLEGTMKRMR